MLTYSKPASDTKEIKFDFTKALAAVNDTISTIEYLADAPLYIAYSEQVGTVVNIGVAGGLALSAYTFGVRITSSGGIVMTDTRRMRINQITGIPVPVFTIIDGGIPAPIDFLYDGGTPSTVYSTPITDGGIP
jgi:hypothetical protein